MYENVHLKFLWGYCFNALKLTAGIAADRLAQLVEHRTAVREVAGSNLGRTNTQGL